MCFLLLDFSVRSKPQALYTSNIVFCLTAFEAMPSVSILARKAFLIAVPLVLTGCASVTQLFSDPLTPENGIAVLDLTAQGVQQFQCTADKQGRYWKFVSPRADLSDKSGKVVVRQGAEFTFRSDDGSVLTSRIVKWDDKAPANDVRSVLFETHGHGKTGILTGVRFVKRIEGKGGIPLTRCSASQLGTFLQVPFTARYVFYR